MASEIFNNNLCNKLPNKILNRITMSSGSICGVQSTNIDIVIIIISRLRPHFENQNGRHNQLFENHALNLEIFQLASSNLHKSYMTRKASLILILA